MRRWWLILLGLPVVIASLACGGSQTARSTASSGICPLLDAGPPPVCPDGCVWNGESCRKHSGIIMPDVRPDAGSPQPSGIKRP